MSKRIPEDIPDDHGANLCAVRRGGKSPNAAAARSRMRPLRLAHSTLNRRHPAEDSMSARTHFHFPVSAVLIALVTLSACSDEPAAPHAAAPIGSTDAHPSVMSA